MRLDEKFRPRDWGEVVGQDKAIKLFRRFEERGMLAGRAYWVVGASGIGKTTVAEIAASKIADPFNIQRLMAGEVTMSTLREIRASMTMRPLGVLPGHALIINEAHGLRKDVIRGFKDLLEMIPDHMAVFFTTTRNEEATLFDDGNSEDAGPFRDRCTVVNLTNQGLSKASAQRALEIARGEDLDGKPLENYIKLAKKCNNSMRRMLSLIEAGEMMD